MEEPKKIVEITASVSAVIPTGNYENFKPMYSIKESMSINGNGDDVISKRTDELRALLKAKLDDDYEYLRIERIKQQRKDIKFRERNGKVYPRVTSIMNAISPIDFDPDKLKQYGSRGAIVHKQINHFFSTGKWETDILQIPETKLDYMIVTQGSLKLNWEDCKFMDFWDKHGKDFTPFDMKKKRKSKKKQEEPELELINPTDFESEVVLFNDEYMFSGSLDLPANYKGVPSIVDFKTSSNYDNKKIEQFFKQLSAYAKTYSPKVKQLVLVPLNPSNKSGYGTPIVEKNIDKYFNLFLQDRVAFKEVYGI